MMMRRQCVSQTLDSGCELLGKKIYCFGGAVRDLTANNPGYSDSFTNNHYVLDLTNFTTSQDAANLVSICMCTTDRPSDLTCVEMGSGSSAF